MTRVLVTGATGFVGGHLAEQLAQDGDQVRCLVRNPDSDKAQALARQGFELHTGDVLDADSLTGAGRDIDVAYYLVHSMGRGGDGDFAERERNAATQFARMARAEGVSRVIYLGGLGDHPTSEHLKSRPRDRPDAQAPRPRHSPTSGPAWSSAPSRSPTAPYATWSSACRR